MVVIQEEMHDVEDGIVIRSAPDHQDEEEGRDSQEPLLLPVLRTKTLIVYIRKIKQCLKTAYNPLNDLSVALKKN